MNDWDVSLVESFFSLFYTADAQAFNEPLDNWDVSAGKNFVSRIRFNMFTCLALFGSVPMLDAESLNHSFVAFLNQTRVFHYFLVLDQHF
jgi:hypothetical protein